MQHLQFKMPILGSPWAADGLILGPSWGHLGSSWGHLGPSWEHLGPSWDHLAAMLGPPWTIVGLSCAHLRAYLQHPTIDFHCTVYPLPFYPPWGASGPADHPHKKSGKPSNIDLRRFYKTSKTAHRCLNSGPLDVRSWPSVLRRAVFLGCQFGLIFASLGLLC